MGWDIFNHFEICKDGQWQYDVLPFVPYGMWSRMPDVMEAIFCHPAHIGRNYELFCLLGGPGGLVKFPPEFVQGQRNPLLDEQPSHWPKLQFVTTPKNYAKDELRGLPRDASNALKSLWLPDMEYFGCAYSVTLTQLLDFNWLQDCYSWRRDEKTTPAEAAGQFYTITLPYLCEVVDDPDDLRMVYWFGC